MSVGELAMTRGILAGSSLLFQRLAELRVGGFELFRLVLEFLKKVDVL